MKAQELEAIYRSMLRIRRFDEGVMDLFKEGLVKGTAHSYVGQEAVAAGACAALTKDDFVVSHHRGHGHCIAKGASLQKMMAELMGRVTGYCKGLGGSMHIADLELNILGANGIVGAGIGIGTGAGLSNKLRGTRRGRSRVLRRRRHQRGHFPRVPEYRFGVEAPGRVSVREQPVRAVDLRQGLHLDRRPLQARQRVLVAGNDG